MTKIDIFSGFLGAGKTTLIKKLLKEAYTGEKLVLIENEFGEIGIDGGFMQDAGIEVTEMNSGCICCSLVGDFGKALHKVLEEYHPDRILIEPSGVGKLSDIIRAVQNLDEQDVLLNGFTTVADVKKCKMYMKNFGEFFNDQISNAGCIVLSHTQSATEDKIEEAVKLLREKNPTAIIVTTPWDSLDGKQLLAAMERRDTIEEELARLAAAVHDADECDDPDCCCHHHRDHDEDEDEHHHHHHHDHNEEHKHHHHDHHHDEDECDDPDCCCHHHHDHDEDEHEHHRHHHHDHDEEHEHHHDHHHGHGHHHHHADEVFVSFGAETAKKFAKDELEAILGALTDEKYGFVLRAKGIVECKCNEWLHFDYVPGEGDVRKGSAAITGRLCVIGSKLDREALSELFGVELK